MSTSIPLIKEVTSPRQARQGVRFAIAAIVLSIVLILIAISDRNALWTVASAEGDVVDEMAAQASQQTYAAAQPAATVTALHKP